MLELLARNWWAVVLRGVLAVLFGVLAYAWPGLTLATLVLLFGAYSLIDGVLAVMKALTHREAAGWWAVLLGGLAGIAIGVLTFAWPGITALVLLYFIAAWAMVTGLFAIVAAIQLRQALANEWLLILSGALSVAFGVLCIAAPGAGALAILWVIAAYAIIFGVMLIMLGFRLRGLGTQTPAAARPA